MDDFFDQSENSMPRIGDQAPAFRSVTTQGTIYFPADYFGKWIILFSYPSDSTPVSKSEFMALANLHNNLKAINCDLIGLPVSGLCFIKEKIEYTGTKDIEIKFPLIEDISIQVARKYGMIQPEKDNSKAVRAVFFIDPQCMIRAIIYYPLSLGLNFEELRRVIVALQTEDEAISLPAKSNGIAKEHMEAKAKGKRYSECFCTRELSLEKVMNVN